MVARLDRQATVEIELHFAIVLGGRRDLRVVIGGRTHSQQSVWMAMKDMDELLPIARDKNLFSENRV